MAKLGKIKATVEQAGDDVLFLTVDEAQELGTLLADAVTAAEGLTTEKVQGVVSLAIVDEKITVGTNKVKVEAT